MKKWIHRCEFGERGDVLSKICAQVMKQQSDWVLPWYERWNADADPRKRRQSIVGLLEYAQKQRQILS